MGAAIADQVVDDRVLELFADGHTVVLQGLHRLWPPLIDFAGELTAELGHPVQINAYVTPSASQGFAAHYDVHDVFVLQIAGQSAGSFTTRSTSIRCAHSRGPTIVRPCRTARASVRPSTSSSNRATRCYLPRGYIHSAEALGDICAHLTVGIHGHTRHAIVEALAELAADDASLRRSLPLGVDVCDPDDLATEVGATVDALIARLQSVRPHDVARILESGARASTRPAPLDPLAQAEALGRLDVDTMIVTRRHLRASCIERDNELTLVLPGRTLRLPPAAREAVDALLDSGLPIRVGDLPAVSESEALALSRDLIRAGVVVQQNATSDS